MERLTTNKNVSEMGMFELAHNSCYIKDRKARYRDYETDTDARELARKLLKIYADGDDSFTSDEDFDDCMMDYLQYGMDSTEVLIALFYRNLWAMADLHQRLEYYEDLEEQGKLLKLPCAVGDRIYTIRTYEDAYFVDDSAVEEVSAQRIWIDSMYFYHTDIGKTVFLTKEDAEAALRRMNGG